MIAISTAAAPAAAVEADARPTPGVAPLDYRPPAGNSVPRRVGGVMRDLAPSLPAIAALVPDHLGVTASEQPVLYWFIGSPTTTTVEFVLIRPGVETPVVERTLRLGEPGIQRIDLAALGVRLDPGVEYEWSVALIADSAQRSRDLVAGGAIVRSPEPPAAPRNAGQLAAHGLWYDALMALEPPPGADDRRLREARAALLEQAGLADVAIFERRR